MYSSKSLDHLGIVSGMIDELELVSLLNVLLETDGIARNVSPGILIKALILNGLGFTQRTLYMVSSFFSDKPIELLLGEGLEASQLNDTVLGRCLDLIYAHGCTSLYANLVPQICNKLGLTPKFGHMDSTDFHVDGVYNSREEAPKEGETGHIIRLTQGYSRDHRPDLNQVVLNLIVENEAGIPIHMAGFDGNTSDKTAFTQTVNNHISQLQGISSLEYLVTDSAGYTEKTLHGCKDVIKWIMRVPENLTQSKEAVQAEYSNWQPLSEGYEYVALTSNQYDIAQRWLLIFSQEAYKREMHTLKKNFIKHSESEYKTFSKLCRQNYETEKEAMKVANAFIKKCKYLSINELSIEKVSVFEKKGRPSKNAIPTGRKYFIQGVAYTNRDTFDAMAHTKGKFIVATNELNMDLLSDLELFNGYKGQSKVERGFRFLKDPQFLASTIFVKKPERVEALLFIMTLSLTVYAAIEHRIRQKLKEQDATLPNQIGKEVKNPSTRWVFQSFSGIHVLYGQDKPIVLNVKELNIKIIELLGSFYKKYYFLI